MNDTEKDRLFSEGFSFAISILEEGKSEEKIRKVLKKLIASVERTCAKLKSKAVRTGGFERLDKLELELRNLKTLLKKAEAKEELDSRELAKIVGELKRSKKQIALAKKTVGGAIAKALGLTFLSAFISLAITVYYQENPDNYGRRFKSAGKWAISKEGLKELKKSLSGEKALIGLKTVYDQKRNTAVGAAAGATIGIAKGVSAIVKRDKALQDKHVVKEEEEEKFSCFDY